MEAALKSCALQIYSNYSSSARVIVSVGFFFRARLSLYELYELYYRITQITGKPVFYIVVQKYI